MSDVQTVLAGTLTKIPNFLTVGAPKSGTTAIWHYLKQHAQVYGSLRKHTRSFAFEVEDSGFRGPPPKNPSVPYAIADFEAYHSLFDEVADEATVGEASPWYQLQTWWRAIWEDKVCGA